MTPSRAFCVAVVGAGPAGMYAIQHLLENSNLEVEIDLYERLPTPWGLVRAAVAPDHPEKKRVIERHFILLLQNPRVRFIGNVTIGVDILHAQLKEWYDAVIYAVGAAGDVRLNIPGEDLSGSWPARQFVGFYSGHPGHADLKFDLSCRRTVIIGNGNVALDLARILTVPLDKLQKTDIADHALEILRTSKIREVVILGRRALVQTSFNNPELEELEHLQDVDTIIDPSDLPANNSATLSDADPSLRRKVDTFRRLAERPLNASHKRIVFRYHTTPVEILGNGKTEQLRIRNNAAQYDENGAITLRNRNEMSILPTGLVFRAIGYRGTPFPGLPFDTDRGVIYNNAGRVFDTGNIISGVYVTGWIKRGCQGLIGSNKKCSAETVKCLFDDIASGSLKQSPNRYDGDLMSHVRRLKHSIVTYQGWSQIDYTEKAEGRVQGRPRVKITRARELEQVAAQVGNK